MYCECGCGQVTKIATKNSTRDGYVRGEHRRFIHGHTPRTGKANTIVNGRRYISAHDMDTGRNDKRIMEHIWITQKALGKSIPSKAVIHHVDEDPLNNKNENLVICEDQAYHMLLHRRRKSYIETGNANSLHCVFCKEYGLPVSMSGTLITKKNRSTSWHKDCENSDQRKRWELRKNGN